LSRVRALDRFEWAALLALLALSFAVLGGLLLRVWTKGGIVTGSDGFLVVDQLQYLNWLRQAGEHGAAANLYDLSPGPHSFVHPGVLISGLLNALGLGMVAAYAVWKPVACGALFAGALLYTRRFLGRRDDRRLALVLALFTVLPTAVVVGWAGFGDNRTKFEFDFATNELWPGNYLWGYMFTAIAVGLLPLALLAYERRRLVVAAALGLLAAWLQPWQGVTFALVIGVAELVQVLRGRRGVGDAARDLALPGVATAAPLVYYLLLSKLDDAWRLAGEANARDVISVWPWWVAALVLAPLAIPAALAYRMEARDFGDVALRVWPIAALVVFFQPFGTFPAHAFQGMLLPLVVLAMLAVRARLGDRPLPAVPAIAIAALLIVPGTLYQVDNMRDAVNLGFQAHFLETGEHDALRHLDATAEPGGVLAPVYSGTLVPAYTGRETWIGAGSWTPDFAERHARSEDLFGGRLDRAAAEALVRESGARFVLSDCHGRADIGPLIERVTDPPQRFGCATVWHVRSTQP
jgi:hypothetical protein